MIALMILVAATVYLVIGNFIVKRIPSKWGKGIAIAILILIPTGDSIVGHFYLNYLCSTEAGVKAYQTVELPAEYWDEKGKARFSVNGGADNRQILFAMEGKTWEDKRFSYRSFTEPYNQTLHVEKSGFRLSDRETGHVFGEILYFMYWGGWLARNFSPHNSAASCEMKNLDDWHYSIFKPATSTR